MHARDTERQDTQSARAGTQLQPDPGDGSTWQIGCARCDGEGHWVTYSPLTRPAHLGNHTVTAWALCPTLGEPILLTERAVDG